MSDPIKIGFAQPSMRAGQRVLEAVSKAEIAQSYQVQAFEERFADMHGRKYCVACSSGTSALTVALAAMHHLMHRDSVSMRADTYPSTANAVYAAGLRRMSFYDSGENPADTPAGVIIATDVMGIPEQLPETTLDTLNRLILEDACEALGSVNKNGVLCGADKRAFAACFSFFITHTVSSGEGGAIVTDDLFFYKDCLAFRDHGRWGNQLHWQFAYPGYNAKMTSLEAILADDCLENLDEIRQKRQYNASHLNRILGINNFGAWAHGVGIIPHAYPMFYDSELDRDNALAKLNENMIEARSYFPCLPRSTWCRDFVDSKKRWPISEGRAKQGLYVPIHEGLTTQDLDRMAAILGEGNILHPTSAPKAHADTNTSSSGATTSVEVH